MGLLSLAACLAPSCGKYFCIGILSKEEIFFIRRVMKNVYPFKTGSLSARRDYDIIYTTYYAVCPFGKAVDDALGIGAAMSIVRCTILQSL